MDTNGKHMHSPSRRLFIKQGSLLAISWMMPFGMDVLAKNKLDMKNDSYDVVIVGGSYAGLAAAMALGRALRRVLVIDNGLPANRQTPYSHNFLTRDGATPGEISTLARAQVEQYRTVSFLNDKAVAGKSIEHGFEIRTAASRTFTAKKLVFATGIIDSMPAIKGFSECWGISALHCPYCHGYEVRHRKTGVLGNGSSGFEFAMLVSNWTADLALFTNGPAQLSVGERNRLEAHSIPVVEEKIEELIHVRGYMTELRLSSGDHIPLTALYSKRPFTQHCDLPGLLGCDLTEDGYVMVNAMQETTQHGVFACGDNSGRMRTVANAVSTGTTAGMMVNKQLVEEAF